MLLSSVDERPFPDFAKSIRIWHLRISEGCSVVFQESASCFPNEIEPDRKAMSPYNALLGTIFSFQKDVRV